MSQFPLEKFLADLSIEEIKEALLHLAGQYFPVLEDAEKQAFVLQLLGTTGDDKLSSMVNR